MGAFLIDESLPRSVTRELAAAGHDVRDVRDIGLRGASDAVVAARATAEARIWVTADLDFSNALHFPPGTHPGIVVLRVPDDWLPMARAERTVAAIREAADHLTGSISVVEVTRIRIFSGRSSPKT